MNAVLPDFEPMLRQAEAALNADPSGEQAVVAETAGGAIRSFTNHAVTSGNTADEAAFIRKLAESGDTRIVRIVCLWKSGLTVDLPSWNLRTALLDLDGANREAKILLQTGAGYATRTVEASI